MQASTTKLSIKSLATHAQAFGLSKAQFDKLTIHEFENHSLTVTVLPANEDTDQLNAFLQHLSAHDLVTIRR